MNLSTLAMNHSPASPWNRELDGRAAADPQVTLDTYREMRRVQMKWARHYKCRRELELMNASLELARKFHQKVMKVKWA